MHSLLREHEAAAALAASGLARALRSGDRRALALACLALHGLPTEHRPDVPGLPSLETVLHIVRELGDADTETHVLATLAHDAIDRNDADEAAAWVLERQQHLGRGEQLHGLTVSVMLGVHVARLRGDHRAGARLHGSIAAHAEPLLPLLSPVHVHQYRAALQAVSTRLGATGYEAAVAEGRLLDRSETLAALLQVLHRNEVTVPSQRAAAPTGPARPVLSPREVQVLVLVVDGLRNKEIAERLNLSPKTVMHHTAAIYRKLGVRGRTEAITAGVRLGVVTVG